MAKLNVVLGAVILAAAALLVSSTSNVSAQPVQTQERMPGQVLVKFKENTPQGVVNAELRRHNGKVADQIAGIGTLVVNIPDSAVDRVVDALSHNPNVEFAEPNFISKAIDFPVDAPNDANFSGKQWGLENSGQVVGGQIGTVDADIDAQAAWNTTTGTSALGPVLIAVLDTGIDQAHPDLSSKISANKDFTGSGSVDDFYGHGTHVGGIAAASTNNTDGVAGTCPDCMLLNGKVLNNSGSGANSWIANGIIWAADNNAKVINLSLGSSLKSYTLESAVNYAWGKGVVVVAAAGNSGNPSKLYPAAYNNVIAVAATDNRDRKAYFSNYGSKWVDVAAPGANIFSTFPTHPYSINKALGYDFASGTSMATPFTAGVAALIWSTPYGTSNSAVRARLESTADRITGTGTYWSAGRINAGKAVLPTP